MQYSANDHTFAVCAYGDSVYLEECLLSLKNQKVKSKIIICTSTPSEYITSLAEKYGVELFVNEDGKQKSNIANDWNYAISRTNTPLVTIAHQDDLYYSNYSDVMLKYVNRASRPIIAFGDYDEIRNNKSVRYNTNLIIKRAMLFPLRIKAAWKSIFIRRRILSFGSAICCPSVLFVKNGALSPLFDQSFRVCLDWDVWERLSKRDGDFVYTNKVIMAHRIHGESETTKNINDLNRAHEDYLMFLRFWPKCIAHFLEKLYKRSLIQNNLEGK